MPTTFADPDPPTCDQCHKPSIVLMVLEPPSFGARSPRKGEPEWKLCPRCHREGLERWTARKPEEEPPPKPAPRGRAAQPPRSQARQPDPDRHPNAPEPDHYKGGARYVPDGDGFW